MGVFDPVIELGRGLAGPRSRSFLFEKTVTIQYPEEKRTVRPRFRGRHVLKRYENGLEKCIGCSLCAAACPVGCDLRGSPLRIPMKNVSRPESAMPRTYEINMLRCIYCGFCEDACPTEAIVLGDNYELSFTDRRDAIYTKDMLLEPVPPRICSPRESGAGVFTRSVPEMKDPSD